MAIEVALGNKISDTLWSASGIFIGLNDKGEKQTLQANVLVKQSDEGYSLHADESFKNGTIGKYPIIGYEYHEPIPIPDATTGTKLNFKEIFVTVKLK